MRFLINLWTVFHSAQTDNMVFKLYYRYTVLILLLFCFVITIRLRFANSFLCPSAHDPTNIVNSYCYVHGVFIDPAALSKNSSKETPYPGITIGSTENPVYVPYYHWVNLFLLVLAILFYLPHLIWKTVEGGLVTKLTSKVNSSSVSEIERKAAIVEIAKYIISTRGGHLLYTMAYILSEVLNWIVGVLLTVWLVNFFNADMHFSSDEFEIESWDDFFAYNFPLMGKCVYRKYGVSGTVQRYSSLCHLPLNTLYGYVFLFLYAWFILLCVLQALVIPYRVVHLILPPVRLQWFALRSGIKDYTLLNTINSMFSLGDWFLLTRLQKNLLTHDLVKVLIYIQNNFSKSQLDLEMDDFSKLI